MTITMVVGDSHAQACFGSIPDCTICWMGPMTMFRALRDGIQVAPTKDPGTVYKALILVFGEIDIRCHALKPNVVPIEQIAKDYVHAVSVLKQTIGIPAYVCTIMPPTDAHHNPEFPIVGTIEQRIEQTRKANTVLKTALQYDVGVIDLFGLFAGPDGTLPPSISDGTVHVRSDIARDRLLSIVGAI